jgi:hypothetical protein
MYVSEIQIDLLSGISIPTIRGICVSFLPSPLTLFVARIRANDPHHAPAANDLAVLTDSFD